MPWQRPAEEYAILKALHLGLDGLPIVQQRMTELETNQPYAVGEAQNALYGIEDAITAYQAARTSTRTLKKLDEIEFFPNGAASVHQTQAEDLRRYLAGLLGLKYESTSGVLTSRIQSVQFVHSI